MECYEEQKACCDAFAFWPAAATGLTCSTADAPVMEEQSFDKHSADTLRRVWHIFWTITPVLCCFTAAQLAARIARDDSKLRFALEFALIALPTVVSVNVANGWVEYFMVVMCVYLGLLVFGTPCLARARKRRFVLGQRPRMLTLVRTTINLLTALCILAIDFESFPKQFRKSRRFGAGLMDVGIGLFVFSMGSVSRRPRRAAELKRLLRVIAPVLLLGCVRTVVIMAIDYQQDEHEYGVHLNAFFTLGLTKLFGTVFSACARVDWQLLPLGLGVLALHEIVLQLGLSDVVMDRELERDNFWTANREGLCSLPGFIGIYLISMYVGQWLQSKAVLSYREFVRKLGSMALVSAGVWLLLLVSIFVVGVARVTCNFGYAAWIFGIALTMSTLYLLVFDFVLDTLWPLDASASQFVGDGEGGEFLPKAALMSKKAEETLHLPVLVEAINYNGLTYFLLANVLTGSVNIFLKPVERTDLEGVIILSLYMLVATGFVYILYRYKIRIA